MVDFAEMAAVKVEDIPEVPLLPMGTYVWTVDKVPEQKPSKSGNSLLINFRAKLIRPIDDFQDPDALDAYGKVAGEIRTLMFVYPTEAYPDEEADGLEKRQIKAMHRLTKFLDRDLKAEGSTTTEKLAAAVGNQFLCEIVHEPDDRNPEVFQERMQNTAPIE